MSTLNVFNITDGTDTVETGYVVNGSGKCWLKYNQATPEIKDSFNTSSVTDNTTGQFTVNLTSNMSDPDYSVTSTSTGNARMNNTMWSLAAGSFHIRSYRIYSTDVYVDTTSCVSVLGDLA